MLIETNISGGLDHGVVTAGYRFKDVYIAVYTNEETEECHHALWPMK